MCIRDRPEPAPTPPAQPASPRTPLPFTPPETVDDLPMRNNPPAVTEEPDEPAYFIPGEGTPAMDLEAVSYTHLDVYKRQVQ